MTEGFIILHRKITENWIWEDKPFSKGQAWIDILMLVNHQDNKVLLPKTNELVTVKRGEHITSELKLADRWGWSKTKVRNFLKLLSTDGMIEDIKKDRKRTRLKVLNYNDYQGNKNHRKTTGEPDENHRETSEEPQKNINNNDNNDNNDNNIKLIDYWNSFNISKHTHKNKAVNKAIKKLSDNDIEDLRTAIKRYSEAYKDKDHYYKHKWALDKFIKQGNGYVDWLDEGQRWIEYGGKNGGNKKHSKHYDEKTIIETYDEWKDEELKHPFEE
jgi:hypothetical protein